MILMYRKLFICNYPLNGASQFVLVVKNLPANAGNIRDMGSVPGWKDSLEEGIATHSSILAWRIPWTGSLVGYSPRGHTELDMTEVTEHTHMRSLNEMVLKNKFQSNFKQLYRLTYIIC